MLYPNWILIDGHILCESEFTRRKIMAYGIEAAEMIKTERVFLDFDNPRHDPMESQEEVIRYLCEGEQVYELAKDLVLHGLSPLELFALIPRKEGRKKAYTVAEGNRRLCALKLLNDPDLAPASMRKKFQQLSSEWEPIPQIFSVVFKDKDEVDLWIVRLHEGAQGGVGRKKWNADQIARHSGKNKNFIALTLLDYAENEKMITAEDRAGKLTTAQRYLSNTLVREAIGVDTTNPEEFSRTRDKKDFDLILNKFVDDLKSGVVHSRDNKIGITSYSRKLGSIKGLSNDRIDPESITAKPKKKKRSKKRPSKQTVLKHIPYNEEIHEGLKEIPSFKLEQVYYSLCDIELSNHTPLLSVGAWLFLETLTAKHGRGEKTDFHSYFSNNLLTNLGVKDRTVRTTYRETIKRISEFGNSTKHHTDSAAFNGNQLANDMETLYPLISALIDSLNK